jgi:hypothetical protein
MRNIEIPQANHRDKIYRMFEIFPGVLSWLTLALPIVLSLVSPTLAAYFIIAFLLLWFIKTIGLNVRMYQGFRRINQTMAYDWPKLLRELDNPERAFEHYEQGVAPNWHRRNLLANHLKTDDRLRLKDVYHVIMIAVSIEGREIVEPTIKSILNCNYDMKKIILIIAYEERCGEAAEAVATGLVKEYDHHFYHCLAIKHPANTPGEMVGKGANITHAGRQVKSYLDEQGIDCENVIVTTLDADNRPHPQFFSAVAYAFIACPDRLHTSFQPVTLFTNNIWDAPAPMRVIASGNSFWNIVLALRPHMLRNFSAHSQSMQALVDTDFWSVRTIVEDGHQFWRTYFRYEGRHYVQPITIPIYQDAVLTKNLRGTIKGQYKQIRRWAWGASDIAYVLQKGWREKNNIPKANLLAKTARLIENHWSWATAPLLLLLGGFIPLYIAPHSRLSIVANQLPVIASRIQTVAMIGLFSSMYLSIKLLPPKPLRYKRRHNIYMVIQWVYLPFTTLVFNCLAALDSQTRLIFKRYPGKFDITEKAVKYHQPDPLPPDDLNTASKASGTV